MTKGKKHKKKPKPKPKPKRPKLEVEAAKPLKTKELPRVSIVILNLNGKHHMDGCFESLFALDYPEDRREVILIDNASVDGSVEYVREKYAWLRLVVNSQNVGFSAGCNQGAREANRPDVLVFLNNDMRVEPDFLRQLVAPIVQGACDATTGKMLSWDGKRINSAGGGMNLHGIGFQRGYEETPDPIYDVPRKTLFACGGAMAIDPEVFESVGGFDEEFFAYYEDVDLGWRLWVLGHSIHYVPSAVCYHHHSSTSRRLPKEMIRLLQMRNPLLSCFKNYEDENLRSVLPAMLALTVRRMLIASRLEDTSAYRIEKAGAGASRRGLSHFLQRLRRRSDEQEQISKMGVADLLAVNDLLGDWDHWIERRKKVQSARRRSDAEIFSLFLRPHWCVEGEERYRELQDGLTSLLGLDRLFEGATEEESPEPPA